MKELTTKKEALDVVKQMVADGEISQEVAEKYFPELQESEDEKIRKVLIKCLKWLRDEARWIDIYGISFDSIFAWLEKQSEQKIEKSLPAWSEADEAHLHSLITHLEQWIKRHPNTTGADIQGENVAWLKSIKLKLKN